ncbi:hypothetical protein ACJJTC_002721 [Scirpophaga incertulas]
MYNWRRSAGGPGDAAGGRGPVPPRARCERTAGHRRRDPRLYRRCMRLDPDKPEFSLSHNHTPLSSPHKPMPTPLTSLTSDHRVKRKSINTINYVPKRMPPQQHQLRIQSRLKQDPKAFWHYIKSKRKAKSSKNVYRNGSLLTGQKCVDGFAKYFHSVYSTERAHLNIANLPHEVDSNVSARIHVGQLQLKDVNAALKRLKSKTSAGPDGIITNVYYYGL